MTVLAYLEQMVSATKTMLNSARCDHPGRPIVLVGWRSGAAIALQVAASESIAAVVCLGLATRSVDGPRGEPNDVIYSVTCPILFITGEYSTVSRYVCCTVQNINTKEKVELFYCAIMCSLRVCVSSSKDEKAWSQTC